MVDELEKEKEEKSPHPALLGEEKLICLFVLFLITASTYDF